MIASMQPDMPPSEDPQVLQDEFDTLDPTVVDNPDAPPGDSVELFDVALMPPGTPCYGVACIEGIPDGSTPKRMWAPGALTFAPTPFPFKFQPAEGPGHDGAMVSGRIDAMWRDGSLIRWVGCMDSAGMVGAEHERLIAGGFQVGVSIKADDIEEADVEMVYAPPPDLSAVPVELGPVDGELDGDEDFHLPGQHNQKDHGRSMQSRRDKVIKHAQESPAAQRLRASHQQAPGSRSAVEGALVAHAAMDVAPPPAGMAPGPVAPVMMIYHSGRVRSLTGVAEPAFVECTVSLGVSPFRPPLIAQSAPAPMAGATPETVSPNLPPSAPDAVVLATRGTITAAGGTVITIPEIWPESWFERPTDAELAMCAAGGGAIQITPEGRVYGLMAPARVGHRGFRAAGQYVTAPRGIDYSEWQNKPCLVAGADGGVWKILAGTATFDCGHPDPYDPRRKDPSFAARHYDDSCSVAMRARAGEHPTFGTWFAGGLRHGLDGDQFERIMGCALSGDWQGGKLKGALLVPVEGFPVAASGGAMVREKFGTLVASAVPIRMEPEPIVDAAYRHLGEGDFSALFDLVASATGRGPQARFDELANERFADYERERG